jgi:hypothetical protein
MTFGRRSVRLWEKIVVPGIAAMAIALLGAAGASGVDEMASARIEHPASAPVAATAGGQPPLRHLILLGLAKGSLPGGLPHDELREEKYEESYQEALGAGLRASV